MNAVYMVHYEYFTPSIGWNVVKPEVAYTSQGDANVRANHMRGYPARYRAVSVVRVILINPTGKGE